MSDIGSSGEDSMTFVEDKINDPPDEEERDEKSGRERIKRAKERQKDIMIK